jgi:divalent metal cation (Fe/Co/Zn/Cd) transporter
MAEVAAAAVRRRQRERGPRVLMDEALPEDELDAIRAAVEGHGAPEIAGFHKLRARKAGSRRYVDLHVQFIEGTSLERAHQLSHELQDAIHARIPRADILIHLEPDHVPSANAG